MWLSGIPLTWALSFILISSSSQISSSICDAFDEPSGFSKRYPSQEEESNQVLSQSSESYLLDNSIPRPVTIYTEQPRPAVSNRQQQPRLDSAAGKPPKAEQLGLIGPIEHRLDRLEFELRKEAHLWRTSGGLAAGSPAGTKPEDQLRPIELHYEQVEAKWTSLAARLDLLEKFIANSFAMFHQLELKVKHLSQCDCQKSCRWSPPQTTTTPSGTEQSGTGNSTTLLKKDGESWQSQCDLCTCHSGQVRCRHQSCPETRCTHPIHVPGECCPVCKKDCVFKSQSIRHGEKLVMSNGQSVCKECKCMDGQLRCQFHHLDASGGSPEKVDGRRPTRRSSDQFDDESSEDFDSLRLDSFEFYEDANEISPESDWRTRRDLRVGAPLSKKPFFCPALKDSCTKPMRFNDDCCTYCADDHDFCSHAKSHQLCHSLAICESITGVNSNNSTHLSSIRSMFNCTCPTGFKGDGRWCRDIDECASSKSNQCERKSSNCINLDGKYECACKQGFERAPGSRLICVDINECDDHKLNKCHSDANCVNLRGGYKCHCKPGYLGNGFHCTQWLPADRTASVATYFVSHSQQASNRSTRPQGGPIGSISSDPTDEASAAFDPLHAEDQDLDQEQDSDEDEEEEEQTGGGGSKAKSDPPPAKLTAEVAKLVRDSKWEPIKFTEYPQTNHQQTGNSASAAGGSSSTTEAEQEDESHYSANTRTMFFQRPPSTSPRLKMTSSTSKLQPDTSITTTASTTELPAITISHTESYSDGLPDSSTSSSYQLDQASLDRGQTPITSQQIQPATPFNPAAASTPPVVVASGGLIHLSTGSRSMTQASGSTPPTPRKKGIIIASGESSPTRGYLSRSVSNWSPIGSGGSRSQLSIPPYHNHLASFTTLILVLISILQQIRAASWSASYQSYGYMFYFH